MELVSTVTGWARNYKRCTKCSSTSFKHRSRGLCSRCYERSRTKTDGFSYRAYKFPHLTDSEKGYIAGLFDGEGCIGLYQRQAGGKNYRISIHNTHRPTLIWVKNKLACGSVYKHKRKKSSIKNNKPCYQWTINSKPHILSILTALKPFIRIKAKVANKVVRYISKNPDKRVRR